MLTGVPDNAALDTENEDVDGITVLVALDRAVEGVESECWWAVSKRGIGIGGASYVLPVSLDVQFIWMKNMRVYLTVRSKKTIAIPAIIPFHKTISASIHPYRLKSTKPTHIPSASANGPNTLPKTAPQRPRGSF